MLSFLPLLVATAIASPTDSEGWIVLDVKDNTDITTLEDIAEDNHLRNVQLSSPSSDDEGIYRAWSHDVHEDLELLAGDPRVEVAEPLIEFHTTGYFVGNASVNDPDYAKQWHMKAASSEYVWANTKSGEGIVVAVLDTGFTITKDFNPAQVVDGKGFTGEGIKDGHGHGTHCASTIAQWTDNGFAASGLAKNALIMPVKVLSNAGSGQSDWIAAGIDWAADHGAQVISMSLGSSQESKVISRAIDRAIAKNVLVVAASGNDGGPYWGFPAAYGPVISVGASGPDGLRSPFSNYNKELDIVAPGGNKQIAGGGVFQWISFQGKESLQEWQGTSMATPHVAAAVAVLLGEGAAVSEVEGLLKSTADKPKSNPEQYGAGLMNLEQAVKAIGGKSEVTGGAHQLPYPNPAGSLTFVVTALAALTVLAMSRVYKFSSGFAAAALAVAFLSSGPLYVLTYLPVNIPGLSVFMVPWLEIPDYLIGKGISGNPIWLSFTPLLLPFLTLTPFTKVRPIIIGLLASTLSYMLLDTFVHFNPVWWMTSFGSSCWLSLNSLAVAGMLFTAGELHAVHTGKGIKS